MNKTTDTKWEFLDDEGTYRVSNSDKYSYLYFPLVNENGFNSSITPELRGDIKKDLNSYLMVPAIVEDIQNSMYGRNFWLKINQKTIWSAVGNSAKQIQKKNGKSKDSVVTQLGFLYHKLIRTNSKYGLESEITSFIPAEKINAELTEIKLTNRSELPIEIELTSAIPIYARSADTVRDHRHVTSLLNVIETVASGVKVKPTLFFDERGHTINELIYSVLGYDEKGNVPVGFYPVAEDFVGEGGSFYSPHALKLNDDSLVKSGKTISGYEALGGLKFSKVTIKPNSSFSYYFSFGIDNSQSEVDYKTILNKKTFQLLFDETKEKWNTKLQNIKLNTADKNFDNWFKWVSLQPTFRRIMGNSYLPYHDYGRGGRGWRDLWQDLLSMLLMDAADVSSLLLNNFGGIRIDGTNATIIGRQPGEFKADRNNIPRVWMDHAAWPLYTVDLYLNQTGDLKLLFEEATYFKDQYEQRCKKITTEWDPKDTRQKTRSGELYFGTVLEHLLLQNLTSFFNVGANNNLLLEGADWNDGLDMGTEKGESVAFTAFYAGNLAKLAEILKNIKKRSDKNEVKLLSEMKLLLNTVNEIGKYSEPVFKQSIIKKFNENVSNNFSGEKSNFLIDDLCADLEAKSKHIIDHIRANEWIEKDSETGWFNGYYDNFGDPLEGFVNDKVKMTLTGQVFNIMFGISTPQQTKKIINAVNKYLWSDEVAGCKLNTDFESVLLSMGRSFGFAYGHKENGAMFSHMSVMYAAALLKRGFAEEGHKILLTIYKHCIDINKSKIYPGIPEYIEPKGRGMYTYLTGSASWYFLAILTQVFGVKGHYGDLAIEPNIPEEFWNNDEVSIQTSFAKRKLNIQFKRVYNAKHKFTLSVNKKKIGTDSKQNYVLIQRAIIEEMDSQKNNHIELWINNTAE
ncbi:MAG: cellobiose phosphorylase [Melioribacteraceae bacterium]|nr:cellobiose phosphorylase [Melioribacteraceae bacterium]